MSTLAHDTRQPQSDDLKPWKNFQVECLLVGVVAHLGQTDDGRRDVIVTWRQLTASFDDLDRARAWLRRFQGGRSSDLGARG